MTFSALAGPLRWVARLSLRLLAALVLMSLLSSPAAACPTLSTEDMRVVPATSGSAAAVEFAPAGPAATVDRAAPAPCDAAPVVRLLLGPGEPVALTFGPHTCPQPIGDPFADGRTSRAPPAAH
ncbi:hypothetical protein Cs7R123_25480 [Catellatospora sp. TT07R-123]|uniref:hypothetical protein n=1 Tax=Catellatospora sp. TT07R-123 TaxID=2733863 RepID=UPI001B0D6D9D|nr:hypothetical protein [Catellatospora sp. TT07R-123]GHJ45206.1 hypothetical protein Cs7R123_25480 [Catellatospora sp. TT07R-123]